MLKIKTYQIEITETLSRVITVEAENPDKAMDEVLNNYDSGEIVLDSNDFMDVEFTEL